MLHFDDPRWNQMLGGYRTLYDPRNALSLLETGTGVDTAWGELWQELHHQGDVGEASYAALPEIVRIQTGRPADWNAYALAAVIEKCRHAEHNPTLPAWLHADYMVAWKQLMELGLQAYSDADDPTLIRAILAVLAFAKGQTALGSITLLTEDERVEMLTPQA